MGIVVLKLKKGTKEKLSPKANYVISMVFLLVLVCPIPLPSVVSIYQYIDIEEVKYTTEQEMVEMFQLWQKGNEVSKEEKMIKSILRNHRKLWRNQLEIGIAVGWLLISVRNLLKTRNIYRKITHNWDNEEVTDKRVCLILERCKKRLHIRRKIRIVKQYRITMPATIGVFKVKILVTDLFLGLDDTSIENVFMHELSHYKRRDNIINVVILIMKAIYWFQPLFEKIFKEIRDEMEFATDGVTVKEMDLEQQRDYCNVMIAVSNMLYYQSESAILGVSGNTQAIVERICMIGRKEKFEEKAKQIAGITFLIILLLCLFLYPTSYGMFKKPRLYIELENGEKIEAMAWNEEENIILNEIRLKPDSEIKLKIKGGKPEDYIFYNAIEQEEGNRKKGTTTLLSRKMKYFESGEFIYRFTMAYSKRQSADYAIKVIVE